MARFFLSYRRDDNAGFAGRLSDALEAAFGVGSVFRDVDDIRPGVDFAAPINSQLQSAHAVLVMIGPHWLEAGADGRRRIDEPDDFVRCEVAAGLASGKPVIPLLLGNATMPEGKELPNAIAGLARHQAAANVMGLWSAQVKYDWGDQYDEVFEFKYLANTLPGTASFARGRLTIEQAKLEDEWLNFVTHSKEFIGDGESKEVTHHYIGQVRPDGIHFTLEISGGYSVHKPVEFVAKRQGSS